MSDCSQNPPSKFITNKIKLAIRAQFRASEKQYVATAVNNVKTAVTASTKNPGGSGMLITSTTALAIPTAKAIQSSALAARNGRGFISGKCLSNYVSTTEDVRFKLREIIGCNCCLTFERHESGLNERQEVALCIRNVEEASARRCVRARGRTPTFGRRRGAELTRE